MSHLLKSSSEDTERSEPHAASIATYSEKKIAWWKNVTHLGMRTIQEQHGTCVNRIPKNRQRNEANEANQIGNKNHAQIVSNYPIPNKEDKREQQLK